MYCRPKSMTINMPKTLAHVILSANSKRHHTPSAIMLVLPKWLHTPYRTTEYITSSPFPWTSARSARPTNTNKYPQLPYLKKYGKCASTSLRTNSHSTLYPHASHTLFRYQTPLLDGACSYPYLSHSTAPSAFYTSHSSGIYSVPILSPATPLYLR
jgi:hypothetical protein